MNQKKEREGEEENERKIGRKKEILKKGTLDR